MSTHRKQPMRNRESRSRRTSIANAAQPHTLSVNENVDTTIPFSSKPKEKASMRNRVRFADRNSIQERTPQYKLSDLSFKVGYSFSKEGTVVTVPIAFDVLERKGSLRYDDILPIINKYDIDRLSAEVEMANLCRSYVVNKPILIPDTLLSEFADVDNVIGCSADTMMAIMTKKIEPEDVVGVLMGKRLDAEPEVGAVLFCGDEDASASINVDDGSVTLYIMPQKVFNVFDSLPDDIKTMASLECSSGYIGMSCALIRRIYEHDPSLLDLPDDDDDEDESESAPDDLSPMCVHEPTASRGVVVHCSLADFRRLISNNVIVTCLKTMAKFGYKHITKHLVVWLLLALGRTSALENGMSFVGWVLLGDLGADLGWGLAKVIRASIDTIRGIFKAGYQLLNNVTVTQDVLDSVRSNLNEPTDTAFGAVATLASIGLLPEKQNIPTTVATVMLGASAVVANTFSGSGQSVPWGFHLTHDVMYKPPKYSIERNAPVPKPRRKGLRRRIFQKPVSRRRIGRRMRYNPIKLTGYGLMDDVLRTVSVHRAEQAVRQNDPVHALNILTNVNGAGDCDVQSSLARVFKMHQQLKQVFEKVTNIKWESMDKTSKMQWSLTFFEVMLKAFGNKTEVTEADIERVVQELVHPPPEPSADGSGRRLRDLLDFSTPLKPLPPYDDESSRPKRLRDLIGLDNSGQGDSGVQSESYRRDLRISDGVRRVGSDPYAVLRGKMTNDLQRIGSGRSALSALGERYENLQRRNRAYQQMREKYMKLGKIGSRLTL